MDLDRTDHVGLDRLVDHDDPPVGRGAGAHRPPGRAPPGPAPPGPAPPAPAPPTPPVGSRPAGAVPLDAVAVTPEEMTTASPALRPLTISTDSSPRSPTTTGVTTCSVPSSTVTVVLLPLPRTAAVGTWRALARSATTMVTAAVIPGLTPVSVRSSSRTAL